MKKKGTTFLEIVIAITIFLIAILPITYLTLNSLRVLKRSSEIEEGARIATSVINYIKSQGYSPLIDGILSSGNPDTLHYFLKLSDDNSSYILDLSTRKDEDGNDVEVRDFEEDFFNGPSRSEGDVTAENSLFLINSLGIASETIQITVNLATSDLEIVDDTYNTKSYTNPITNTTTSSSIIIVDGHLKNNSIIFGNVDVTYNTKSETSNEEKSYSQNFVITPIENFVTSP